MQRNRIAGKLSARLCQLTGLAEQMKFAKMPAPQTDIELCCHQEDFKSIWRAVAVPKRRDHTAYAQSAAVAAVAAAPRSTCCCCC